ncbi:hypothetical protein P5673_022765 [Acropora cervicornis]|uniref:Uncharacterized protein n=1 Tax=Acropora cervicornis TaxID=6130 RepID=A0AAD9Q669_ACRCE|nr:hypothetical protein P5673_022765 [Acropora cervicornis]
MDHHLYNCNHGEPHTVSFVMVTISTDALITKNDNRADTAETRQVSSLLNLKAERRISRGLCTTAQVPKVLMPKSFLIVLSPRTLD